MTRSQYSTIDEELVRVRKETNRTGQVVSSIVIQVSLSIIANIAPTREALARTGRNTAAQDDIHEHLDG